MSRTSTRDEYGAFRGAVQRAVISIWQQHVGEFSTSKCWSPAVNIYRMQRQLDVCVDLAGVERGSIEVRVEMGRLIIRGQRAAPEPAHSRGEAIVRIVAMEIDHGPFSREIPLPENVNLSQVTSTYEHGLLWVKLPLLAPA